jgi:hypothetical protein
MRDEACFKDRSVEVHRCCIYQIWIDGQTRCSTTGPQVCLAKTPSDSNIGRYSFVLTVEGESGLLKCHFGEAQANLWCCRSRQWVFVDIQAF